MIFSQHLADGYANSNAPHTDHSHGSKEENHAVFQVFLFLWIELGEWLRIHHEAVEAFGAIASLIFSGVLTVWNILLWRETRHSAVAVARQAQIAERALIELEGPSVFLEVEQGFSEFTSSSPGSGGGGITQTVKVPIDWHFCFVNYGRTPAFMMSVNGVIRGGKKDDIPPLVDEESITMPRGAVVPPGGKSKEFTFDLATAGTGPFEVIFLTVCCRFADIFGNEYVAGFSYGMRYENFGFRLTDYKDGYNYIRQVKWGGNMDSRRA